ncbi:MAG: hypothetical protein ABIJ12_11400 [bacterium]
MKKSVVVVSILILMLSASANAFDGMRKGFVLGGGLGFGPVAKVSIDVPNSTDMDNSGVALNFLIGYAWDEQNMIVFLRDGITYSEATIFGGSINLVQGFSGVGYYHYFGQQGKSFFITGGLGFQDWSSLDSDYDSNDYGLGMLVGGGYEFARHVQVYSSLSFGKTSDYYYDYNHSQFLITISAVAF